MDAFVRRANIEHYRRLLERTTDEVERQRILRLLEVEEAKMPIRSPPNQTEPPA
jgi:hypothetical protein